MNDRLPQRVYDRSRMPRRYVRWSEKVFYLELSKRKVQVEAKWHEGTFVGTKDESEIAVVGTPHGIVFARSIRRVSKEDSGDGVLFNSFKGVPWDTQPGIEREREREQCCSWTSELPFLKHKLHYRQMESSCPEEFTSGDPWNWRGTGKWTSVSGANT